MRSLHICLAVIVLSLAAFAAEIPEKVKQNITVVSSPKASGKLDTERLQQCLWMLLQQQGLTNQEAPKILVLHVSKAEAAVAGVYKSGIRLESVGGQTGNYYQVWLIDNFKEAHYAVAFQAILRHTFALRSTEPEENAILARVLRMQSATLSAKQP